MNSSDKSYEIYTDGACRGNPGPGGWGVVIARGNERQEFCGGETETTNNRMELQAALEALRRLPQGSNVDLHTDSQYLRNGITQWMANWKKNGWRTAARKPVKNVDLWQALDDMASNHSIEWHWVKAHAGHAGNERADALANRGIDEL